MAKLECVFIKIVNCNQWNTLSYNFFEPLAHLSLTAIHYAKQQRGETLFLAPSAASTSPKMHEKMRERERQRATEITLSKCQNKAENTECSTHRAIYANDMSSVCAGKRICACL